MNTIEFVKDEDTYCFRNPKWSNNFSTLVMEYKVIGVKENNENDGYYYNSEFNEHKKAMEINAMMPFVELPEDIYLELEKLYTEMRSAVYQTNLNKDIKFYMNDNTAYGIYNGISQFDIGTIISEAIKTNNPNNIFLYCDSESIAKELTNDQQIIKITKEAYMPFPMHEDWNDPYKKLYKEMIENCTAPGYAIIPNTIVKDKINTIVKREVDKEIAEKLKKENKIKELLVKANETGEKQQINRWMEPCNDPNEECNLDMVTLYAMPDGSTKTVRNHSW